MLISDNWVTTEQAAEHLGITRPRVNQLIRDGRLAAEKIGRDYFILKNVLFSHVLTKPTGRPPKGSQQ